MGHKPTAQFLNPHRHIRRCPPNCRGARAVKACLLSRRNTQVVQRRLPGNARHLAVQQAFQAVSIPICQQRAPRCNAWRCGTCQSQSAAEHSAAEQRAANWLSLACHTDSA